MRHARPHLVAVVAAGATLLGAAPAGATDFCLNAPGCVGTQVSSVDEAVDAANVNGIDDTLTIGPRDTPYDADVFHTELRDFDITGSGAGATVLRATGTGPGEVLSLNGGGTIRDLTIDGTGRQRGLWLIDSNAERVQIVGASVAGQEFESGVVLDETSSFAEGSIEGAKVGVSRQVAAGATPASLRRTSVAAESRGAEILDGALTVDHARIDAPAGVGSPSGASGTTTIVDSAIVTNCGCVAVTWGAGTLNLTRSTVAGPAGSVGIAASGPGANTVNLTDSIVAAGTDLIRGANGTITAQNSLFNTFVGTIGITVRHVTGDPRFADKAAGDLRLRGDSPVIDAGASALPGTDLTGALRAVDGNGDGTLRADLGAYERQDWSAAAIAPARGTARRAVAFTGAAPGTVPNDSLSYAWKFDDGGTATGRAATHVFTSPGRHTATLSVVDGAGLERTATATVVVGPATVVDQKKPPVRPVDLTPPAAALSVPRQRLRRLSARGLAIRLTTSEACSVSIDVRVDRRTARRLKIGRRARSIGAGTARANAAGEQLLRVKLSGRVRRALRRTKKPVGVTLRGSAVDASGNAAPVIGRATLRR